MEIRKAFTDFTSYIKYEHNLSPNTVSAYRADIESFIDHLAAAGKFNVSDLSHTDVRSYIASLYQKLDKSSIARKTSAIRSFIKHLISQGLSESSILPKIVHPKTNTKLMFALSQKEIDSFFSAVDSSTVLGKRNLAIIELLYGAGLRVSELCGLKLDDIDMEQKILKVLGKGRKQRLAPFNNEALSAVRAYLDLRPELIKQDKPTDYLFLNKSGLALGVRSVQRLTRFISQKAGLLKRATPHTMRHSYATHLLEAGASIKTVKELLGHSSIAATQKYTHLTMEKLLEVYKKAHPKA